MKIITNIKINDNQLESLKIQTSLTINEINKNICQTI